MPFTTCNSKDANIGECLSRVSGWIHDKWFDVAAIAFDAKSSSLSIPLSDHKSAQPNLLLWCEGVVDMDVIDTEKVGHYDVNKVQLDVSRRALLLTGNIPITVSMPVCEKWRVVVKPMNSTE